MQVEAGEVEEAERAEGRLVGRREGRSPGGGGVERAEKEVGAEVGQALLRGSALLLGKGLLELAAAATEGLPRRHVRIRRGEGIGGVGHGGVGKSGRGIAVA